MDGRERGVSESDKWEAFERGRQLFRDDVFRPNISLSDEDWLGPCSVEQCEWLGWMMERGCKIMREIKREESRQAWKDWALGDGPMPQGPAP